MRSLLYTIEAAFRHVPTTLLLMGMIYAIPMAYQREVYMPSALTEVHKAQMYSEHSRCTEDMPCWDCSTMGNLICGRP